MKTLKFISLLFVISILSCREDVPKIDYVILNADIGNTLGGPLTVGSLNGFSKTVNVKEDGQLTDTLMVDEGLYYIRFDKGFSSVYMAPGNVVNLTADAKQFGKTLEFGGANANINNYYAEKAQDDHEFRKNNKEHYALDEATFENKIKELQASAEAKLAAVTDIPDEVRAKEKRALNYARLNRKNFYERSHAYFAKKQDYKASEAFKEEIDELALDNTEDFFFSRDYNRLVNGKVMKETQELVKKDSMPYPEAQLVAASKMENKAIANQIMYNNTSMYLPRAQEKKSFVDKYMALSTNEEHKQKVKDLYKELKTLEPGNPSPKFVDYENNAGGTTSLDHLKGRYVYIDIWATWCGPCKVEIPFLKEIEATYHGKNIEFVSISVDEKKNHQAWKDMIAEKEMTGMQLFADNAFDSDFVQSYKIRGIPRFILLDTKGNIVKSNAPRPSDKKLIALFDELGI